LQATFTSLTGTKVDPTTITLKVKTPSGSTTTYTYPTHITRSAAGIYFYDYSVTASGIHFFNWAGTGAFQAADESSFSIVATVF
jgi:hypothetical protein